MDKSTLTQAMKDSISEVLEQMFFMPIDFSSPMESDADPEAGPDPIIVRIGFQGPSSGSFVLLMPDDLAWSVSVDFIGTADQSLSSDQVTGTVLEMVNMLAGSTLSLYDHQEMFDLQIPELITFNDLRAMAEGGADHIMIRIQTLDSQMIFNLFFH
jgi:CheY-specific phosphatase CheX